MTAAEKGVCVNAFGTNYLNYPDAVESYGGKVMLAPLVQGKSSTATIEKIRSLQAGTS